MKVCWGINSMLVKKSTFRQDLWGLLLFGVFDSAAGHRAGNTETYHIGV